MDDAQISQTETSITITRQFDASRALVWKAWTDPAHIGHWWGPSGYRTTTERMEVRTGGSWRFVMHGPDGQDYFNHIHYTRVEEPGVLEYAHGGRVEDEPVNFSVRVTFEEVAHKRTRVVLHMAFPSKESKDTVVHKYGAIEGGRQTLARLGEYLDGVHGDPGRGVLMISRVLGAPPDLVWEVWSDAEHLLAWFAPRAWKLSRCDLDLRPGGMFHYCMSGPDMPDMWGRWIFREVSPKHRLVAVVSFSNKDKGVERAPFEPNWPLETLSTITIEPHAGRGGGTVLTVRSEAINASEEEHQTFKAWFGSMQAGWGQTLDSLASHLRDGSRR